MEIFTQFNLRAKKFTNKTTVYAISCAIFFTKYITSDIYTFFFLVKKREAFSRNYTAKGISTSSAVCQKNAGK